MLSGELRAALDDRQLIELGALVRPAEDLALYRAEMAQWPGSGALKDWQEYRRDWVAANDGCRRDILGRLRDRGSLPSRELPGTCARPWGSTGWTNNKNLTQLLEYMAQRGEVAVAGRKGRERLWDLASRVYPDDPVMSAAKARRERDRRRLRALGIARPHVPKVPIEPAVVGAAGEPAVVEGVRGQWRVEPSLLDEPFHGRAALLSPFDRLVQRPRPHHRPARVRLPAGDVQARRETAVGLLRPPGPVPRPAGRQGRRDLRRPG